MYGITGIIRNVVDPSSGFGPVGALPGDSNLPSDVLTDAPPSTALWPSPVYGGLNYPTPFLTVPDAGYAGQQLKKSNDVDQLTNAEQLVQDAVKRVSNPNANYVDSLRAENEVVQATEIRLSVMPDLSQDQAAGLNAIINTEYNAFSFVDSSHGTDQNANDSMQLGAQMNQSLIDWILSE